MADTVGGRPKNALMKRHDQLEKWKGSELAKASADRSNRKIKVKFNSGCVFLASCSSGDTDEVKTLLDKGADINYANVDGLTALHQAVIDEKLEMVEFLVENGADIEAQDNEGWTPLHAAASCGFTDIARFLIDSGAMVAACNNEGELPIDLAEEEDMEEMLQDEIDKQGIDVEVAKNEEERKMVEDANQMMNSRNYKDRRHPKSGATPLHVAAAKGYMKCMSLLIQAGADVNALDMDNWTALHAASHWGHKEAAEILAEALANMDLKNNLGQTCFDLAEDDMIKCLEELKKKQASIKKEKRPTAPRIESKAPPPLKRSDGQSGGKSSNRSSVASVTRISAPDRNMLLHQDMAAERKHLEMKIHGDGTAVKKTMASSSSSESESESSDDDSRKKPNKPQTLSKKEVPSFSPKPLSSPSKTEAKEDTPAWRQSAGLRKTGSTSTMPDKRNEGDRVQRSASSPRLSATTTITNRPRDAADRLNRRKVEISGSHESGPHTEENSDNIYTRGGSFTRRRIVADITTDEVLRVLEKNDTTAPNSTITTTSTTTPVVSTATTTIPTATINVKRSYMTPAKDDEAETVRRAKAKRERSTRRSTQGVTAEDIESAYDTLRKSGDKGNKKDDPPRARRVGRVIVENSQEELTSPVVANLAMAQLCYYKHESRDKDSADSMQPETEVNPVRVRRNQDTTAADTTATFVARPRVSSSSDTTGSATLTARSYGRATDEDKAKEMEKEKDQEEEDDSPKKSLTPTTTITRRRPRERRRPTGVISLEEEEEEKPAPTPTSRSTSTTADRYSRPLSTSSLYSSGSGSGRYDSTTKSIDAPSSRADRSSGIGNTSSYSSKEKEKAATTPCQNCKKLFEDKEEQLVKAQDQIKDRDLEIAELKASQKSDRLETKSVDNEKRERRALTRRVSELEEELKKMEKLKADNQRLKDENGALVRVISKLSK